nr:hypothetical protein [Tanacetum cinerariifolium]
MWDVEWIYGQLAIDGCNRHEEVAASYADSRANVGEFHDEVAKARDKSDAAVTSIITLLENLKKDHTKQINNLITNLTSIQDSLNNEDSKHLI